MLWGLDRETLLYLVGAIAVALAAVLYLESVRPGRRERRSQGNWDEARFQRPWKRKFQPGAARRPAAAPEPATAADPSPRPRDAADQLRIVMAAEFGRQRLLWKGEERVFRCVEETVREVRPGCRVMAQVSLGEVLRSPDRSAYFMVNSKRVDLLIVDEDFQPMAAIEYQGGGHHRGDAAARDAVKKEALRKAGVKFEEVNVGDLPGDLKLRIRRLLERPGPTGTPPPP